jgi:hypothetical protein
MENAAEISNTVGALPQETQREKKRSPRGKWKMTHTWHMNEEHEAITD